MEDLVPTVEQCSSGTTAADMKKKLLLIKRCSMIGMGVMLLVLLMINFIEALDIRLRGVMHIIVAITMMVLFIMNLVYLGNLKSMATNNCTAAASSPADLDLLKKSVTLCNTWAGVGIGASVLWMGYYGYRIYADMNNLAVISAHSLYKGAKASGKENLYKKTETQK
jgi:hypothetical protein